MHLFYLQPRTTRSLSYSNLPRPGGSGPEEKIATAPPVMQLPRGIVAAATAMTRRSPLYKLGFNGII